MLPLSRSPVPLRVTRLTANALLVRAPARPLPLSQPADTRDGQKPQSHGTSPLAMTGRRAGGGGSLPIGPFLINAFSLGASGISAFFMSAFFMAAFFMAAFFMGPLHIGSVAGLGGHDGLAVRSPDGASMSGLARVQPGGEGDIQRKGATRAAKAPEELRAELGWITSRATTLAVRRARLDAEMRGDELLTLPPDLEARRDDPILAAALAAESRIFASTRAAAATREAEIRRQELQHRQDADRLRALLATRREEAARMTSELAEIAPRSDRDLLARPRHLVLQRALATAQAETLRLAAALAGAEIAAAEARQGLTAVQSEIAASAALALAPVQGELSRLARRRAAAERQLADAAEAVLREGHIQARTLPPASAKSASAGAVRPIGSANEGPVASPQAGSASIDRLSAAQGERRPRGAGQPLFPASAGAVVRVAEEARLGAPAATAF